MLKVNINDLVHIMKQIKIAENHTATGLLVDHLGNPLNNLTPYGLRTVSGVDNNLVNLNAGAADMGMPRQTAPVFNPAEPNPRTNAPTSYQQTTGSVYDSQPRIISNLIADQTLTNPIAVITALNNVGITGGAQFAELVDVTTTARFAINESIAADKAALTADAAWVAANSPASGELFDAKETALANAAGAGAQRDLAVQVAQDALALVGVEMQNGNLVMPNIMTDLGSTAPLNGFMTIFGQFFDHGLTMINKGGSGTVFVPLQPDDPLYVPGSPTNFMVMSRATNGPGADGILGTADDVRDASNTTTPWIDLNQLYGSNESTQVFLREYKLVDGKPVATGWMLEAPNGGPPTWADIKLQARDILGIEMSDMDVHRVPLLATDLYGNFIPGANGFPQLVTGANLPADLVEGNPAAPVSTALALATGHVFLADIAHNADPKAGQIADEDLISGNSIPVDERGNRSEYDNELLDAHYVVGDGRGNENIALTAIHHVFHSEHNHRVDQMKDEIIANGDVKFLNEWLNVTVDAIPADVTTLQWNGERLFQAARWSTEQVYQHLVFEEFARLVSPNIDPFLVSNTVDIDPAITAEFAHAVYRFGHSQLNETVDILAADGQTDTSMTLVEAFLNPGAFAGAGATVEEAAGAIFRGMTRQVGNEIDEFVTDALRNDLVGLPLDLATLNIARGRETGMASLNLVRADFYAQTGDTQLKPYDSWYDFALAIKNPASVINFIAAYGQHETILAATTVEEKRDAAFALVLGGPGAPADRIEYLTSTGTWNAANSGLNAIDFWIGGLAEKKMAFGGLLGTTFNFVFEVQMENLQAGDRFYYLSRSQGMNMLTQLEGDSWAKLAMRNTDLGNDGGTHLPSSMFLTASYILELNQSVQGMADPVHDNMILQAISPMVMRKDTNGDGTDDYLRYNGVDHVVLGGTVGNDTLIGGEGDDTLWGGKGDDNLEGGQGVDHISGGYGDDVITDGGVPVGAGDVLNGEEGNDVISAGEGLDLIFGGSGQDFILGGRDIKNIRSGEDNDFVVGGNDASIVLGNEGDDWLEGGDGLDDMAGDNAELFLDSRIIGHDVLNGRRNDSVYMGESGDDIMIQGLGQQRSEGMSGFDWAINKDNPVGAVSDLGVPIFTNVADEALADRFDNVEGLSGWKLDDMLSGREDGTGLPDAAIVFDAATSFLSYSNALTAEGVARIDGLADLVSHLGRETITAASGEQHEVVVFNQADLVRNLDGVATDIVNQPHDIILGGGGNDRIEGMAGDDIIDGDRWLNVRISINDANGVSIATAEHMTSQVWDLQGTLLYGGRKLDQLMLDRTINPGQLSIVREVLDGGVAGDLDTAVYRGQLSDYTFVRNADGSTTVTHVPADNVFDDGSDRLFNIEKLTFADGLGGTVTYDINAIVPVAATGEPTISNITPTEREVLSVDLSTIVELNTIINPTYQWQVSFDGGASWTDIVGAVDATFTPGQDEVGGQLRVNVAWFDLTGTFENLNSAPTAMVADFAEAATGAAIISDMTPYSGQVLTIDTASIADANGVGPLSHQWQISTDNGVSWTDIAGANGDSYVPADTQLGAQLRVMTTFTDVTTATVETLYSEATAGLIQGPVAARGAPVILDSTPMGGEVMTADISGIIDPNGVIDPAYQWQVSTDNGATWTNIDGATANTFTPTQAQVSGQLRVQVSWTDGLGTQEQLVSAASVAVADMPEAATGAAVISDMTPFSGEVLTIDTASIADANGVGPLSHQWQISTDAGASWADIDGANGDSYVASDAQLGAQLRVKTTFTDLTTATVETVYSEATAGLIYGPVAARGAPVILDSTPIEGEVMTADISGIIDPNGVIDPAYQWQVSTDNGSTWTNIDGATANTFTPTQAQVSGQLRVQVSWTDGLGTQEQLVSAASVAVADLPEAATGSAIIDDTTPYSTQVLTIDTASIADANGVGPLSHQWQISTDNGASWTDIAGATDTSYTTSHAQVGASLRVKSTFTDVTTGTVETLYSPATSAISQGPAAATGAPVINDLTPTETQTLTIDTSSIADINGLGTFSYQWQQSADNGTTWTNINGATAASFTPAQAQVGSILRVAASFTDGFGTVETLNSTATAEVGDNFTGATSTLTTFTGTQGDDIALGAQSNLGLGGNDTMDGRGGSDRLDGQSGNDAITGGAGNDTIIGGAGTDAAVYAGSSQNFTLNSNGTTITVTDNTGAEGVDTLTGIETLRFNGANHTIANGTAAANTVNGGAGSEVIFAQGGNDSINGGAGNDVIYAGTGVDTITQASATGGRDFADGGTGEDTFIVTSDTTTAETFVIYTRAAAQEAIAGLTLNANTEIVITRNGNVMTELDNIEEIIVSTLRVTSPGGANGGAASGDTISVVGDFNQTSLNFNTITIDGNTGNDVVDISALQSAHRIVFTSNGGQDTIVGALRPQDIVNLDTAAAAPVAAHVTQVDAPVAVDAPAPVAIEAVAMAVEPAVLIADMVLTGSSSDDYLAGDAGDDSITGGSGYDYLDGGLGDDRLSGGSGNDSLVGGDGDDTLSGGSGNDYLDGGLGDDELIGGTGIDAFAFGNGDTIADFMAGDVIDLREMGVTAGNFAEKVLIETVRGGSRITIDGQSMMVVNATPAAIEAASLVLADPVAPAPAPVVDAPAAPAADAPAPAPVVDAPAPVVDAPAAPAEEPAPAPVVDAPAPVVDAPAAPAEEPAPAPVVDAPAPVVDAPAAPAEEPAPAPVVDAPAPVVDAPAAPAEEPAPAPVVDAPAAPAEEPAPAPVVDAPVPGSDAATDPNRNTVIAPPTPVVPAPVDPVADAPAPVVDAPAAPAPVVDAPAPVVDVPAPAPVVDAPAAPVADAPAPTPVVDAPAAPVVDAPVQTPVIDVPAPVNPGQGNDTPVVVDDGIPADLALEPTPSPLGDVNMRGSRLADVLIGDDDGNDLFGFGGNDALHGMYGDDVMNGGRGADMLYGGEGNDRLFGSRGMDYLDGGEGADILSGGRGSDIFAFGDQDVITDFKSGEDMIDLNGMGITESNFEDMVSITRDGSDLKVSIAGQTMTLNDERDLDIDDFMLAWEDNDSPMITDAIAAVEEASPAVVDMVAVEDDTFGPANYESLLNLPADLLVPVQQDMFGPMM